MLAYVVKIYVKYCCTENSPIKKENSEVFFHITIFIIITGGGGRESEASITSK